MKKTKISFEGNRVDVDQGFIDGLEYMGTLTDLYCPNKNRHIPQNFRKPLYELFRLAKTRMKFSGRDRDMPERLSAIKGLESFADFVSDTDEKHTIAVVNYASRIATGDLKQIDPDASDSSFRASFSGLRGYQDYNRKMLLSAAICHDCAYPITTGTEFREKDIRELHQQNASQEFRKFAEEINKKFNSFGRRAYKSDEIYEFKAKLMKEMPFYEKDDVDGTSHIISLHDIPPFNPSDRYIELLLSHREADRLWMLDRAGFALDILRKLIKSHGREYNPLEMLAHNVARHIEEEKDYTEKDRKVIVFKSYLGLRGFYPTLYVTDIGFKIFQELIEKRWQEYEISKEEFFESLDKRLKEGEIK